MVSLMHSKIACLQCYAMKYCNHERMNMRYSKTYLQVRRSNV